MRSLKLIVLWAILMWDLLFPNKNITTDFHCLINLVFSRQYTSMLTYKTHQQMKYEEVLTTKECTADDDDGMLCYKQNELITVIDK